MCLLTVRCQAQARTMILGKTDYKNKEIKVSFLQRVKCDHCTRGDQSILMCLFFSGPVCYFSKMPYCLCLRNTNNANTLVSLTLAQKERIQFSLFLFLSLSAPLPRPLPLSLLFAFPLFLSLSSSLSSTLSFTLSFASSKHSLLFTLENSHFKRLISNAHNLCFLLNATWSFKMKNHQHRQMFV